MAEITLSARTRARSLVEQAHGFESAGFPDRAARRIAEAQVFATLALVDALDRTRGSSSTGDDDGIQ